MRQAVITPGKGAITFAIPTGQPQPNAVSLRCKAAVRALAKTSYILTPAQQALSAGGRMDTATHHPPPPPLVRIQSPVCIPPGAVRCLVSNPINNAFVPRILVNEVANSIKGKPRSLMQPQLLADMHPFRPTRKQWRHGIKVDCGPNWCWDAIEAAIERGPHPTACTSDAHDLFKEEITYQVTAGFSKVMLWGDVKHLCPKNLKISPVALIPQGGHRGRIILDLSFSIYQDVNGIMTVTQESVNSTMVLTAPSIPVKEIGKMLPRLLHYMRDTPRGLHILFCKLDISDGFWHLTIQDANCFNFAYVLPQHAREPICLVIAAAVQMGWVESPGFFCAVTESARDLTQHFVDDGVPLPKDPVEDLMKITDVPLCSHMDTPTKLLQVYVDDFCHAATQSTETAPTSQQSAEQPFMEFMPCPPPQRFPITKAGRSPSIRKKGPRAMETLIPRRS
jgi:hypothetical protein